MIAMAKQKELFDGFVRLRNCLKCDRKLHIDRKARYATREAGLCYACLREFEVSPFWTVDKFIENANHLPDDMQKRIDDFFNADLDKRLDEGYYENFSDNADS